MGHIVKFIKLQGVSIGKKKLWFLILRLFLKKKIKKKIGVAQPPPFGLEVARPPPLGLGVANRPVWGWPNNSRGLRGWFGHPQGPKPNLCC
jgi:hypothetical protein